MRAGVTDREVSRLQVMRYLDYQSQSTRESLRRAFRQFQWVRCSAAGLGLDLNLYTNGAWGRSRTSRYRGNVFTLFEVVQG